MLESVRANNISLPERLIRPNAKECDTVPNPSSDFAVVSSQLGLNGLSPPVGKHCQVRDLHSACGPKGFATVGTCTTVPDPVFIGRKFAAPLRPDTRTPKNRCPESVMNGHESEHVQTQDRSRGRIASRSYILRGLITRKTSEGVRQC